MGPPRPCLAQAGGWPAAPATRPLKTAGRRTRQQLPHPLAGSRTESPKINGRLAVPKKSQRLGELGQPHVHSTIMSTGARREVEIRFRMGQQALVLPLALAATQRGVCPLPPCCANAPNWLLLDIHLVQVQVPLSRSIPHSSRGAVGTWSWSRLPLPPRFSVHLLLLVVATGKVVQQLFTLWGAVGPRFGELRPVSGQSVHLLSPPAPEAPCGGSGTVGIEDNIRGPLSHIVIWRESSTFLGPLGSARRKARPSTIGSRPR
mmetsp:Transcript_46444/g.100904  ORF Transcript_46444/g.100904 Transcript_46444/m.100904 type:complete len:261 (+) Transcript_46444:22-804(+)